MSKDTVSPYKMNLPTDLKNRLQEAADRSGRSLSSEIITRLQASVALSDDMGLEFTEDAILMLIGNVVSEHTAPLEGRIEDLEAEVRAMGRTMDMALR